MSANESIQDKIKASSSYNSLLSEQLTKTILDKLGWETVHGGFYTDPETQKPRESDVIARWHWQAKTKEKRIAGVNLVCEMKSLKGFHILLSETRTHCSFTDGNRYWMGSEGEVRSDISRRLAEIGFPSQQISTMLQKFGNFSYPRNWMRLKDMQPEPAPATIHACAYRETNVGQEKELENSVIWKASLALKASIGSLKKFTREQLLETVEMSFLYQKTERLKMIHALSELQFGAQVINFYHPVILSDAKLWVVNQGGLIETDSCRFIQQDSYGHTEWWFDIVNADHARAYFSNLTRFYRAEFRKRKCNKS